MWRTFWRRDEGGFPSNTDRERDFIKRGRAHDQEDISKGGRDIKHIKALKDKERHYKNYSQFWQYQIIRKGGNYEANDM